MGLFSSLFGKKEAESKPEQGSKPKNELKSDKKKVYSSSAPSMQYVQTARNRETAQSAENDVLVLWWLAKKKKGYDKTSNKFPKWFANSYGIDFNRVMSSYIRQGCLSDEDNIVKITDTGKDELKKLDYVVYLHEHAQYALTISDFKNAPNLHKVQNADIAWGIFNRRLMKYIRKGMWESLSANYGNMASLLLEEKKYEQALEFIFAAAYVETSGMKEKNELTAISTEKIKDGWEKQYLENGMPDIFMLEINNYYVTVPFLKVQENLNLEWDDIRERFISSRQIASLEMTLPFKYFEKEESFEIFKEAILVGRKKGRFSLKDVSKKLKYNIPDEHSNRYFYASVENKVNQIINK
ncbi:MAG: hypothetical protein E7226_03500 [Clostridiales bacterium]|nr:hypothetical protein [Clostridiales bacterium]